MNRELIEQLANDMGAIVAGGDLTTPHALDLFFAYRLLLQRHPEFGDVESYRLRTSGRTVKGMLGEIMQSLEYQRLWLRKEPWSPDAVVMAEHAGLRYFFHLRDRAIGMAIATGQYEPGMERLVRNLVKPGMRCADVGANLGFFSILLGSLVGPSGHVYSFEPFPGACELLLRNIRENRMESVITSFQVAAHDHNGKSAMCYRADESNDNFGSMFVPHEDSKLRRNHASVEIQCQRLDDLIPEDVRLDLVKIDVEGSEPYALAGMSRILRKDRPILLLELNESCLENMGCTTAEHLMRLLEEHGYVPCDVDTFLTAGKVPYKFQKQSGRYEFRNLICIPSSDVSLVAAGENAAAQDLVNIR